MTRIASFCLYECKTCGQIHIAPEYGSISVYIPPKVFYKPTDLVHCKGCHTKELLKDFIFLGSRGKKNTRIPTRLELRFRELINKPYVELDVRKLFPRFDE